MPHANDKYNTSLDALREGIDAIDRNIARLLLERSDIVAKVGELKKNQGVHGSYIRARRESVMLRDMLALFAGTRFPQAAAATIWRTIIGASTAMESPLNLSVLQATEGDHSTHLFAREYFGSFIPCILRTDAATLLADLARNPHTIGVVPRAPGPQAPCWWELLAELPSDARPSVFASLPFVRSRNDAAPATLSFAIGQVELNPSGDDRTLFSLRMARPAPPEQLHQQAADALATHARSPGWIEASPSGRSVLLELEGFLPDPRDLAAALSADYGMQAVCLGAYATPCPPL